MRRPILGLAAVLGIALVAPMNRASAQMGGGLGGDPFSLYYGYYLPHQAAVAAQPTPLDTINAATAARIPRVDRDALYAPTTPFGEEELDPLRPFSSRNRAGAARAQMFPQNTTTAMVAKGPGASRFYYNRTAQYYASLRPSYGPNRNLAVIRRGRGSFGGGMPGMPSMPGPR